MKICFIGNSGHANQTYREMQNCPDTEFVGIAPSCELEDDVIASVNIDFLRPSEASTHSDDRIRIAGTDGVIEVFENRFIHINKDGVKEYFPETAPKLAFDYLQHTEELSVGEIFMPNDTLEELETEATALRKIIGG